MQRYLGVMFLMNITDVAWLLLIAVFSLYRLWKGFKFKNEKWTEF